MTAWRPVLGYEGRYEVSDDGRVRSVTRTVVRRSRWGGTRTYSVKGRGEMIRHRTRFGHLAVGLESKTHQVHRLVLEAFAGPCPVGMECRHLDGIPWNNHLDNLAWGTRTENAADKIRHGRSSRGERAHNAKLTDTKVRWIRSWLAIGVKPASIAQYLGVSRDLIYRIRLGRSWRHVLG